MKISKLIQVIEHLNLNQQRDLIFFIQLPSNRLSVRDQEIFSKLIKKLKEKPPKSEEAIWNKILNQKEQENRNRIKNRILKALQRYICMIQLESDSNRWNLQLSKFYSENQIEGLALKAITKGIKDSEKLENWDNENDIFRFWFYEMGVNITKEIRRYDSKIQMMEASLQNFYDLNRIRLLSEKANRYKIINAHKDYEKYVDEIEIINRQSKSVHVHAYYHAFKLNTEGHEVHLHKLEAYLKMHGSFFKKSYLKEFYEQMMNFCIRKINANQYSYAENYLSYIEQLEAIDQLLKNGILEVGRLRNTVLACIIADQSQRGLQFIEKYQANLAETNEIERKPFLYLNIAVLELYNGNPKKCFENLDLFRNSNMYFKDVYFKMMSENLLMKVYYERGDYGATLNGIETMRTYIKSQKKLNANRKRMQLLFLKILKNMAEMKSIDPQRIRGKVPVMDYIWLRKVLKWSDR